MKITFKIKKKTNFFEPSVMAGHCEIISCVLVTSKGDKAIEVWQTFIYLNRLEASV